MTGRSFPSLDANGVRDEPGVGEVIRGPYAIIFGCVAAGFIYLVALVVAAILTAHAVDSVEYRIDHGRYCAANRAEHAPKAQPGQPFPVYALDGTDPSCE